MILSKQTLPQIKVPGLAMPPENVFNLPEKVLQFGTGVLLRGLPDYYIDKANRAGVFNGRVVVVKSTDTGSATDFDQQDSLYTLSVKGIEDGKQVDEQIICSAISRVLSAGADWNKILEIAKNPDLKIVTSNTTEVGIQLDADDKITNTPPASFPGKLLAVLHERYQAFEGSAESGLVIVPAELIVDNGKKLKNITLELARLNGLDPDFITWLQEANYFCNTLVDRIVPGKPGAQQIAKWEEKAGYQDGLHIVSEVYSLWAIEGGEEVKKALSFSEVDKGVVIVPDIEIYRELKLRLLNATHTLSCALAFLSGFKTVKEAMDNDSFSAFIDQLMLNEIAPAIPYNLDASVAREFAGKVADRFRNPNIEHQWISISAQYSSKIKLRVLPLLLNHYRHSQQVPQHVAAGFAAFLRFMKSENDGEGRYTGNNNGQEYVVTDSNAEVFEEAWQRNNIAETVHVILSNEALWDTNLCTLPGFENEIVKKVSALVENGGRQLLNTTITP